MTKSTARRLQEHSLEMALAAIEIYNKPTFPARDLVFPILMVNAWEALAKAKLLADNKNRLQCIRVKDGNRYKKKANGDYMTIGALKALEKCQVSAIVFENVRQLTDIRDAATHLPSISDGLKLLNYNLGTASLQSYAILSQEWFGVTLSNMGLFVMPLSFSTPFAKITTLPLDHEPESIARIVKSVRTIAESVSVDSEHQIVCEIKSELISVSKTENPDIIVGISPESELRFRNERQSRLQRYPLSYAEVLGKVKEACPEFKQGDLNRIIKENEVKGNEAFSSYSYLNLRQQLLGPKRNTTCIYNYDFVRFCTILYQRQTAP